MNKQEMQNKIEELEKQLTKLKEGLNKPESKVWKPKVKENYYIVGEGGVCTCYYNNSTFDNFLYAIGNCFKTREEAEFEVERLKVIAELKRFAQEHNEPIDWNNDTPKYSIAWCYNDYDDYIFVDATNSWRHNDIYFSSEKLAKEAIKQIGEEKIKKYYLGVKDD